MSKVEIKLNLPGINELMKSPEMVAALQEAGDQVAASAGAMDGAEYAATTHQARWIAVTNVFPNSQDAAHKNFKNNTLLKALGGVGMPRTKDAAKGLMS